MKRVTAEKDSVYKGFQRFRKLTAGKCLHAPKPPALPAAPYPDIQYSIFLSLRRSGTNCGQRQNLRRFVFGRSGETSHKQRTFGLFVFLRYLRFILLPKQAGDRYPTSRYSVLGGKSVSGKLCGSGGFIRHFFCDGKSSRLLCVSVKIPVCVMDSFFAVCRIAKRKGGAGLSGKASEMRGSEPGNLSEQQTSENRCYYSKVLKKSQGRTAGIICSAAKRNPFL